MDDNLLLMPVERKERADAQRNRRLLLDTALRLFNENGVANVTMSAVAEEAKVGKGTLYRHFADKSALIFTLLDEDMHDLQARVFTYLARPVSACDKLRWFSAEIARFVVEHIELLSNSAGMLGENSLTHPAHGWWLQTLQGLLRQLPECADPIYTAHVLYVMVDVRTIRFQMAQGFDLARITAGLSALLDQTTRRLAEPI